MDDEKRYQRDDSAEDPETSGGSPSYDEPISAMLIHEAAAAIEAVGRELTRRQGGPLREFLRGPAVRVGVAVSVLGATLWIQELIESHRARTAQPASRAAKRRPSRRRAAPASL